LTKNYLNNFSGNVILILFGSTGCPAPSGAGRRGRIGRMAFKGAPPPCLASGKAGQGSVPKGFYLKGGAGVAGAEMRVLTTAGSSGREDLLR
jgi:hypothetical protein